MDQENLLEDYSDTEKLEVYYKLEQVLPIGKHLVTYNIRRFLPDVKGKTVLDLPCGIGSYERELFRLGASKVIAGDIVSEQLTFSKEKDRQAGIPEDFVDYYQIDATSPRQLSNELVDVCLSLHLLCFAENERDLRAMVQTIFMNLKPGGCCLIHVCTLNSSCDSEEVKRELEQIVSDEKLVHVDPPSSDRIIPRRYHTVQEGFHFNRFVWSHEVICDILHEEGFSKVELTPFEVDPSYSGDIDLQAYIKLHDYKLILAWKRE